ncbi:MAG: hypothetical protein ACYC8T_01940 [Myxococcaceae bacterium]
MNALLAALLTACLAQAPDAGAPVAPGPSTAEPAPVPPLVHPATPSVKPAPNWTDRVKLSGLAYLRYSFELTPDRANFNELNFDRIYLTSEFQLVEHALVLATLEAGDIRLNGTANFMVAPKYVYVEGKDLGYAGSFIRAGLVQTGWTPYIDNLWGYRVQGASFTDRWGYMTSSDLGIVAGGPLPPKYGSWQLNFQNGEGWKSRELGKRKEGQARVTVKPLTSLGGVAGGFFVSGFASLGGYDDVKAGVHTKRRYIGQVGFQNPRLTIVANYTRAEDASEKIASRFVVSPAGGTATANGFDAFAVLNLGLFAERAADAELFVRGDMLDPDTAVEDDGVQMFIAGGAYRVNKYVRVLGDWERVVYGPANALPNESRLKLHCEAKF